MDTSHRHLSDAFLDMQRAMEQFEPFFEEFSEDEDEFEYWEEDEESVYFEDVVPYRGFSSQPHQQGGPGKNRRGNGGSNKGYQPATDLFETPDAFELHIELPGYDKKNIKIDMPNNNRTLVLKGTLSTDKTNKKKQPQQQRRGRTGGYNKKNKRGVSGIKSIINERNCCSSFTRTFTFPIPVNHQGIKASFENGLLKIVVPKYNKTAAKQIEID